MPQPLNDIRGADPDPRQRASLAGASSCRLGLEYQHDNWHTLTASAKAKQCELVSAGRRLPIRRLFRLRVGQRRVGSGCRVHFGAGVGPTLGATTADGRVAAFGGDIPRRQVRPSSSHSATTLNGCSNQEAAIGTPARRRSGQGRFATDTSPDSSPKTRRLRFASRKLLFADQSCRPVADVEL